VSPVGVIVIVIVLVVVLLAAMLLAGLRRSAAVRAEAQAAGVDYDAQPSRSHAEASRHREDEAA
jgi:hypothetical protein